MKTLVEITALYTFATKGAVAFKFTFTHLFDLYKLLVNNYFMYFLKTRR